MTGRLATADDADGLDRELSALCATGDVQVPVIKELGEHVDRDACTALCLARVTCPICLLTVTRTRRLQLRAV